MQVVSVPFPEAALEKIEDLVKAGVYMSRADAIRNFTNDGLRNAGVWHV